MYDLHQFNYFIICLYMYITSASVILTAMAGGWLLDSLGFRRSVLGGVSSSMAYR